MNHVLLEYSHLEDSVEWLYRYLIGGLGIEVADLGQIPVELFQLSFSITSRRQV